jgi:hypothetical protein
MGGDRLSGRLNTVSGCVFHTWDNDQPRCRRYGRWKSPGVAHSAGSSCGRDLGRQVRLRIAADPGQVGRID